MIMPVFVFEGTPIQGMPGLSEGPCPVIRFYGITMEGNSVLCHVHGFLPYFYTPAPKDFNVEDCEKFRAELDKFVLADMRSNKDDVTTVNCVECKNSISIVFYRVYIFCVCIYLYSSFLKLGVYIIFTMNAFFVIVYSYRQLLL